MGAVEWVQDADSGQLHLERRFNPSGSTQRLRPAPQVGGAHQRAGAHPGLDYFPAPSAKASAA
jgi:hypothetical protein